MGAGEITAPPIPLGQKILISTALALAAGLVFVMMHTEPAGLPKDDQATILNIVGRLETENHALKAKVKSLEAENARLKQNP